MPKASEEKSAALKAELKRVVNATRRPWAPFRKVLEFFFLTNNISFVVLGTALLIVDAYVTHYIIQHVPYTEIDWSTYMQQVECVIKKNTHNYSLIVGDTGPIVYPGGHLLVYKLLYTVTGKGKDIRLAQYLFMALYLANLFTVFRIYYRTRKVPPFVLVFLCCTGYRIHSIFVLRMFNDPIAMYLFYIALNLFLSNQWSFGSVVYSFAVSIKMNVLLFAPAMFFTMLLNVGLLRTAMYIALCGLVQVYVAIPFLFYDPVSYVRRSFDIGRVFLFKWTVNWRFLPESLFLDPRFHGALLVGHVTFLAIFAYHMWFRSQNGIPSSIKLLGRDILTRTSYCDAVYAFFTANLIGITFSRSLHYQFYSWYFHQLPFLLFFNWEVRDVREIPWTSTIVKCLTLLGIELCWNVYPSRWWSSALLHTLHIGVLSYLVLTRIERPEEIGKRICNPKGLLEVFRTRGRLAVKKADWKAENDFEKVEADELDEASDETGMCDNDSGQTVFKLSRKCRRVSKM